MDKGLRDYTKHIETRLKHAPHKELLALYERHLVKTRDFQHERLIHLLVTLFFGLLFLFSLITFSMTASLAIPLLTTLCITCAVLLFVTEIFYIRYYYILENGVQKLYKIGDKIAERLQD